jgi:hypothetical protein
MGRKLCISCRSAFARDPTSPVRNASAAASRYLDRLHRTPCLGRRRRWSAAARPGSRRPVRTRLHSGVVDQHRHGISDMYVGARRRSGCSSRMIRPARKAVLRPKPATCWVSVGSRVVSDRLPTKTVFALPSTISSTGAAARCGEPDAHDRFGGLDAAVDRVLGRRGADRVGLRRQGSMVGLRRRLSRLRGWVDR